MCGWGARGGREGVISEDLASRGGAVIMLPSGAPAVVLGVPRWKAIGYCGWIYENPRAVLTVVADPCFRTF